MLQSIWGWRQQLYVVEKYLSQKADAKMLHLSNWVDAVPAVTIYC